MTYSHMVLLLHDAYAANADAAGIDADTDDADAAGTDATDADADTDDADAAGTDATGADADTDDADASGTDAADAEAACCCAVVFSVAFHSAGLRRIVCIIALLYSSV